MNNIEQIDNASKFLRENSLKENSIARKCCMFSLDIVLLAGLVYLSVKTYLDRHYWQSAPCPLYAFILVQYLVLALIIRVPVSRLKQATMSAIMCVGVLVLKLNSVVGLYWLHSIYLAEKEGSAAKFDLKTEYAIEATILAFVPVSIFVFLVIVVLKIICFYFAEQSFRNKKKKRTFNAFDNEEEEDPAEIEAVVSIYYRAME